jgi:plastocyanin
MAAGDQGAYGRHEEVTLSRRARQLSLSLVALVTGTGAAFVVSASVGAAAPSTASFTAQDFVWQVTGSTDTTATIAAGGTVTFGYPTGISAHNVDFDSTQPASCTQTSGSVAGPVPPLPAIPTGEGWAGTCPFNTPGTYSFHCDMHPFMAGVVVVEGTSTTTPGGTTPGGTTPGGTTSTGSTTAPTSTGANSTSPLPRAALTVARHQKGVVLRGSVTTPAGPSQIVVTAHVSNRALSKHRPKRARQVRVGTQTKRSTGAGKTSFAVKLNASARRALHRRHRLAVNLRIVVTPSGGPAAARTVAVALRER